MVGIELKSNLGKYVQVVVLTASTTDTLDEIRKRIKGNESLSSIEVTTVNSPNTYELKLTQEQYDIMMSDPDPVENEVFIEKDKKNWFKAGEKPWMKNKKNLFK